MSEFVCFKGNSVGQDQLALHRICRFPPTPTAMPLSILLLEDEIPFREAMCDILNLEGFAASGVGSLSSFQAWRTTHSCDVLIVDRNLPDGDGLDAVRLHRQGSDGPVIVLTARGQLIDRVEGLNAEADYYLQKPVDSQELLAVLKRVERRLSVNVGTSWLLDKEKWSLVTPNARAVELTRNEICVMSCFFERGGFTVPKAELISALGHDVEVYDPRRLEVMIRRLRNKVEAVSRDFPLVTIYGVGYSFNARLSQP